VSFLFCATGAWPEKYLGEVNSNLSYKEGNIIAVKLLHSSGEPKGPE